MGLIRVAAALMLTVLAVGAELDANTPGAAEDRNALRKTIETALNEKKPQGSTVDAAAGSSDAVRRWMKANRAALDGIRSTGGIGPQPWGPVSIAGERGEPSRVYLYVFDWHASGKLVVYGLTGGVGKAYLLKDPAKAALPSARVGRSTVYSVPKEPPDSLATVVVLELNDKLEGGEIVVSSADDGRVLMHARDAYVHGVTVRYEPEPHKDTIGYWTNPADWVSWEFEVKRPGKYAVEILQGCGKGNGGSAVEFSVGEQVLPVTVEDTGGFQNFVPRQIGQLSFDKPGRYTLNVKPVKLANKAVMDLRSVTLTPK